MKKVTSTLSEYANAHKNIDIYDCWLSFLCFRDTKTDNCMHTVISAVLVSVLCLIFQLYFLFVFGATALPPTPLSWAGVSPFTSFIDHTQRPTTVGRSPLDE